MTGPLQGLKVLEFLGIGPAPFCAMLLADMGADVLRIERPGTAPAPHDVTRRGRTSIELDLRQEGASEQVLGLVAKADILIEGFRPRVMERLGVGPEPCLTRRPALVYGRMTGWGQTGPLSHAAGHDINYLAISGALHAIGRPGQPPVPPLNFVGDYGGGAMLLATGILAALHEVRRSGRGQVVDAAMSDGAALLSAHMYGSVSTGRWINERGANVIDGGAHFYDTYECADGKYVAIGAIEPAFYALLRERCGLQDECFDAQMDRAQWPQLKRRFAELFRSRTRAEWVSLLEGTDACFAPVLDWHEAPRHPHNAARGTFMELGGVVQPAPAPRFSATPCAVPRQSNSTSVEEAMRQWEAA